MKNITKTGHPATGNGSWLQGTSSVSVPMNSGWAFYMGDTFYRPEDKESALQHLVRYPHMKSKFVRFGWLDDCYYSEGKAGLFRLEDCSDGNLTIQAVPCEGLTESFTFVYNENEFCTDPDDLIIWMNRMVKESKDEN